MLLAWQQSQAIHCLRCDSGDKTSAREFYGRYAVEFFVRGLPHATEAANAQPLDKLQAVRVLSPDWHVVLLIAEVGSDIQFRQTMILPNGRLPSKYSTPSLGGF
jgi:hypothetical protein